MSNVLYYLIMRENRLHTPRGETQTVTSTDRLQRGIYFLFPIGIVNSPYFKNFVIFSWEVYMHSSDQHEYKAFTIHILFVVLVDCFLCRFPSLLLCLMILCLTEKYSGSFNAASYSLKIALAIPAETFLNGHSVKNNVISPTPHRPTSLY